jgi:hypothetical protein
MIPRLALFLLIAGCVLFGVILFIEFYPGGTEELSIAEIAPRREAIPAAGRQTNPRLDELVATILARPLFSSTRRPPQNAPAGASADSDLADTRLTGIVTEPRRRLAIFAVNGEKPLKVAEGDAVSGWRIESITAREVSLSGPSGSKTLQPKMDPNLAPPAGQPPAVAGAPGARLPVPQAAAAGRPPVPPAGVVPGQANINTPGIPRPARPPRQQR